MYASTQNISRKLSCVTMQTCLNCSGIVYIQMNPLKTSCPVLSLRTSCPVLSLVVIMKSSIIVSCVTLLSDVVTG